MVASVSFATCPLQSQPSLDIAGLLLALAVAELEVVTTISARTLGHLWIYSVDTLTVAYTRLVFGPYTAKSMLLRRNYIKFPCNKNIKCRIKSYAEQIMWYKIHLRDI